MFCKKCGKQIAEDSEFCKYCGQNQNKSVYEKPKEVEKISFMEYSSLAIVVGMLFHNAILILFNYIPSLLPFILNVRDNTQTYGFILVLILALIIYCFYHVLYLSFFEIPYIFKPYDKNKNITFFGFSVNTFTGGKINLPGAFILGVSFSFWGFLIKYNIKKGNQGISCYVLGVLYLICGLYYIISYVLIIGPCFGWF